MQADKDFFKSFHFIALLASMMALSSLAIDAVLPAFPAIVHAYHLDAARHNDIQLVIYAFMLGFAIMQFFFGILADMFGRKSLLLIGTSIYIAASLGAVFTKSFDHLLILRFIQGMGGAATRTLSLVVVRDVASGNQMSRIMSFAMMVFLVVPILAPIVGQITMKFGDWHSIFYLFALLGVLIMLWVIVRLPETLPKKDRRPPKYSSIYHALKTCFTHRQTLIYMLMMGFMFAMMMSYVGQSEQIFGREVYQLGDKFVYAFSAGALGMVIASFTNASIVMYFSMRRIVFVCLSMMILCDIALCIATFLFAGKPPLSVFMAALIFRMFCFGMTTPNLNALIMEPHKHIAGTVSAVVGTLMTVMGLGIARLIGLQFHGNLYPLVIGWISLSTLAYVGNAIVNCTVERHFIPR